MNTKAQGNLALGRAVSHFTQMSYLVFMPFGDNSAEIDLVVSPDGKTLYRVQCKHTVTVHPSSLKNYGKTLYQVDLRVFTNNNLKAKRLTKTVAYTADSFDVLFVSTPERIWLLDWAALCRPLNPFRRTIGPPSLIVLGNRAISFAWQPVSGNAASKLAVDDPGWNPGETSRKATAL